MDVSCHNWPPRKFSPLLLRRLSFSPLTFFYFSPFPRILSRFLLLFLSLRQQDKVNVNDSFTLRFFFLPFKSPFVSSLRHGRLSTRFQDYDENLTSAKVVSVRRISHFSGTRFSASPSRNFRDRIASKIVFPSFLLRVTSNLLESNLHVN